jgi:hypothetical protein
MSFSNFLLHSKQKLRRVIRPIISSTVGAAGLGETEEGVVVDADDADVDGGLLETGYFSFAPPNLFPLFELLLLLLLLLSLLFPLFELLLLL